MLKRVKKYLKNNRYTKDFYQKLVDRKIHKRDSKIIAAMHQNSDLVIEKVSKSFVENDIKYFYDFGTLLGIVREGRLLVNDLDIDIAVLHEEGIQQRVQSVLKAAGFSLFREFILEGEVVEQAYVGYDVKVDINYYYNKQNKSYCYLFYRLHERKYQKAEHDTVELVCDAIDEFSDHVFNGIDIKLPKDPEHLLVQRYGKDWRIPNSDWEYWEGPSTSPYNKQGIMVQYKI